MQAARGTSITTPVWSRRRAVATMLGLGGALIVADQVAKAAAVAGLREGEAVSVIPGVFSLELLRNPGAAFSLGTSATWLFTLLAAAALVVLLGYVVPRVRVRWWCVSVGLFIAGVGGNLIDRVVRPPALLRGHVVDFLFIHHWPVFNVADMCITGGAILVVVLSLFGRVGYDGRSRESAAQEPPAADRAGEADA